MAAVKNGGQSFRDIAGESAVQALNLIREYNFSKISAAGPQIVRVVALGDIIGDPGRKALFNNLRQIKDILKPDILVLNGENSAHGFGITEAITRQILDNGFDAITAGNHIWQKKEVFDFLDKYQGLLRPLNYPDGTPGHGSCIIREMRYNYRCCQHNWAYIHGSG